MCVCACELCVVKLEEKLVGESRRIYFCCILRAAADYFLAAVLSGVYLQYVPSALIYFSTS